MVSKGFSNLKTVDGTGPVARFSGFLRTARLRKRIPVMVALAAIWGFSLRLGAVNVLAGFLAFFIGLLFFAGLVWVGFGLFRKVSPAPEGKKPTPRFVRIAAGLVVLSLSLPIGIATGHAAALVAAPYSEAELRAQAESAEQRAAEVEARRQLEEETAAAEAAEILAAEREVREAEEAERAKAAAEKKAAKETQEKIVRVIGVLKGLPAEEAKEVLQGEGLPFVEETRCSSDVAGTVVEASYHPDLRVRLFIAENATTVPDVIGKIPSSANRAIESGCYRVEVVEFYAKAEAGSVFGVSPEAGTVLAANERVTIFVAKPHVGVRYVANSLLGLASAGPKVDDWEFSRPFEKDGKLYVPISASFGSSFDWRDTHNSGTGFGKAVIADEFNKEVPVIVHFTTQRAPAGKEQFFTIEVPLTDLQIQRPTKISPTLYISHSGRNANILGEVTLSW